MKARKLTVLLAICCIIACVFCLVACSRGGGDNTTPPKQEPFTVTFDTNGGSAIAPIDCTEAKSLRKILGDKTTEKEGQIFTGWYKDAECQNKADLDVVIKADKTFYAGWRDMTSAEVLESVVLYAQKNAVAIKDTGYVRTGRTNSDVSTSINAVWTLDNGTITSGCNSARYYSDGALYGIVSESKTKLIPNDANDAVAYLYHGSIFRSLKYFDAFAPLAMGLVADADGCVLTATEEGYQVKYTYGYTAVQLSAVKYGNPWVYFDGGKTFDFKVVDGRLVEAKQSGSRTRTIQFF
ncbi:MAG: InlB B-repeat-containing protein, partial [Clostridia bacterium]|nr:InlB B-repeat-containing protein [Clostridia bacterium]